MPRCMIINGRPTLKQMIDAISAGASLNFCLDAGALASYGGSGQVWGDLSGNDIDWNRGSSGDPDGADPAFNGTVGKLSESEFWSFDGGDCFSEALAHTFAEGWHKDNAALTLGAVAYLGSAATQYLWSTALEPGSGGTGSRFYIGSDGLLRWNVVTSGSNNILVASAASVPTGALVFLAVALDESVGSGGGTFQINGTQESFSSTYATPTTSSSNGVYTLGNSQPGQAHALTSGSRLLCMFGASRRWSDAELSALRVRLRTRFPTLP